jgi:hypothetical protein
MRGGVRRGPKGLTGFPARQRNRSAVEGSRGSSDRWMLGASTGSDRTVIPRWTSSGPVGCGPGTARPGLLAPLGRSSCHVKWTHHRTPLLEPRERTASMAAGRPIAPTRPYRSPHGPVGIRGDCSSPSGRTSCHERRRYAPPDAHGPDDKETGPIWLTRSVTTDIQQFDMPS